MPTASADHLARLAHVLRQSSHTAAEEGTETVETFEVSRPTSTAAALYERVRNTLEYQEEHLLRRNAILRMVRRVAGQEQDTQRAAEALLEELVLTKYLPNRTVPLSLVATIAAILSRYAPLAVVAENAGNARERCSAFVMEVLATEIERVISGNDGDEELAAFMYEELWRRTEWDPATPGTPEEREVRFFTAVYRTLRKVDPATLRYRIFLLYYPAWSTVNAQDPLVTTIAGNLVTMVQTIDAQIANPLTERLTRMLRRKAGVFRVLGDVLRAEAYEPAALNDHIALALEQRTKEFRARLSRTVFRSILFLFFTKTALAVILEIPYDLLSVGYLPAFPLAVNILFHPLFLAMIALTIRLPGKDNLHDYQASIRALRDGEDHPLLHVRMKRPTTGRRQFFFSVLYAVLFVGVYVGIAAGLRAIGFHVLSTALFLFFFSLMAFFGVRIRSSTRDIILSDHHAGWLGTAFDILLLPVVRAGSWLAAKVAKVNIFIYFFDFIVEAPLKVAIAFVEGWLRFVREKKEEI